MTVITLTSTEIRKAIVESLKSFPDAEDLKPEQMLIVNLRMSFAERIYEGA